MDLQKKPESPSKRNLQIKVDAHGWFNSPAASGPFTLKGCWLELTKLGDNKIPALNIGDIGQIGIYKDLYGNYIVYLKHNNQFCRFHELVGYEFTIIPKPSKLEIIILALAQTWADPHYPWPFV